MWNRFGLLSVACLLLLILPSSSPAQKLPRITAHKEQLAATDHMSAMGHLAFRVNEVLKEKGIVTRRALVAPPNPSGDKGCTNAPDCNDDADGPAGGQAETTIAIDHTGQHVVVGFNDTRGFSLNPISVSGFMYSDDGGKTFTDGGQLPSPGTDVIGTTKFPEVFGDPDVKYLGACTFVYSSIILKKFSDTAVVQTMGIHRSTDCGHTWTGPFEVTAATNPNGLTDSTGNPVDAADKEFIDVDRSTGRLILSWTNFTPVAVGGIEMSTTYSDNVMSGNPPTWSTRQVVSAIGPDGQSSVPRFAGNGTNAYVVWRRFPSFYTNTIAFARSTDNGATWKPAVDLTPEFFTTDFEIGNDRPNNSPSLAVDHRRGTVYLVYANNNLQDGSDIVFQRSSNRGVSFSNPVILNSRPGQDRAQWFPWVSVDSDTGRVWVFYYDQGIATSGDLSEVTYTYSDNGGRSWSAPAPLTDRPFHAGWGNDTGQPNLGDYNQAVAQDGELFATYALASRPPGGFVDGEPTSTSMTVPDVIVKRLFEDELDPALTLNLSSLTFTDSGGNGHIDPNETVQVQASLFNYDTNPLNAARIRHPEATVSTSTPGVKIVRRSADVASLNPGQTGTANFVLKTLPGFVPGTPIELTIRTESDNGGSTVLHNTLFTGTPIPTQIFAENFDEATPGTLPPGWLTVHGAGANVVPWTSRNDFCGSTSNAAFHINANDGATGKSPSRWERLISPSTGIAIPANTEYVTLDFDVCYDTEDDPNFNIQAYDGAFLRVTDLTTGHILRSVLLEAFEDEFTTGAIQSMPKHEPRSGDPGYFPNGDMSMWAGFSNGPKHVHLRLPGMAGTTVQLRFEFAQDGGGICTDVRPTHADCGISVGTTSS
jgi:hypothetical protein